MDDILVKLDNVEYNIYINNNFDNLNEYLNQHKINEKILIVTDNNVGELYGSDILKRLNSKNAFLHNIHGGEDYKTLDTIQGIYEHCYQEDFNRASAIIAIGGGIVGDTAGFAASTFMRGIKLVHIPTTIIADVDSSVGGKVGVNFKSIKNMVGDFYHPEFIYINTSVLRSLKRRHVVSGMAEIIKYAIIYDYNFFEYLNQNIHGLLNLESDKLNYVIRKCIHFKVNAVKSDVYDNNERQMLNFGHTMGHVVESMSSYLVYHGEAVAIGMMFECALSNICGIMNKKDMLNVFDLISRFGLNRSFDFSNISAVFDIVKHDKKAERGNIRFIMPKTIGCASIVSDISEDKIAKAFQLLKTYWG